MGTSPDDRRRRSSKLAIAALAVLATLACNDRGAVSLGKTAAAVEPAGPAVPRAASETPPEAGFEDPRASVRGGARAAILLPLSGPRAGIGRGLLDAALLAEFSFAADGFVLMPFDTAGSAAEGAVAARLALDAGAGLILGPVFSDVVAAAAPVARAAGVDMLAFSNDSAVAGPGVYLASLLPETQIARVVDHAVRRGRTRFAALLPRGRFGDRARAALAAALSGGGAELSVVETFDAAAGNVAGAVSLLASRRREAPGPRRFDALFVAASGQDLIEVGAHLGHFDLDAASVRILGLASWSETRVGREPALVGGRFAAVPTERGAAFAKSFEETFGARPGRLAAAAYDMTALAAIRADAGGEGGFERAALDDASGFAGAGGVFRFRPDGRSEHLLEIRQVEPWENRVVEPAPERFAVSADRRSAR